MNRDEKRARELIAESARKDVEKLRQTAKGEHEADPDALAERIERALRMLERTPTDVID